MFKFIFLLQWIPCCIFAQQITSLENQWKVEGIGDFGSTSSVQLRFSNDSLVVNGHVYRKLTNWNTPNSTWIPYEFSYWRDGSDSDVYMLTGNEWQGYDEELRYAFNVVKGDTLTVTDVDVVVNWVSKVKYDDDSIRLVSIRSVDEPDLTNLWIEGGAAIGHPFSREFEFSIDTDRLLCYWKKDTLRVSTTEGNCEENLVSILSSADPEIVRIWPNPTSSTIHISVPGSFSRFRNCHYQLISIDGVLVDEQVVPEDQDQVAYQIPTGISGVHLVRIWSDQGYFASGIILIE
ncbi:MAG: hypothetical protein K9I85_12090 [Saprospiraceae bacterium]|nr:hypothetical protein [Saprospiraceae bacterium]